MQARIQRDTHDTGVFQNVKIDLKTTTVFRNFLNFTAKIDLL